LSIKLNANHISQKKLKKQKKIIFYFICGHLAIFLFVSQIEIFFFHRILINFYNSNKINIKEDFISSVLKYQIINKLFAKLMISFNAK